MQKALLFPLLLLLLASSCKKKEIPTASTYTFTNASNKRINVDVYESLADYATNSNRAERFIVEPGKSHDVAFKVMDTVWVDWYSDDYSFNNWEFARTSGFGEKTMQMSATMPIALENDRVTLGSEQQFRDSSRSVLLNGNETSSTWEVLVADAPNPIYNGVHRFELRKDFRGEYTFINKSSIVSKTPISFQVQRQFNSGNPFVGGPFDLFIYRDDFQSGDPIVGCDFTPQFGGVNRDRLTAQFNNQEIGFGSFSFIRK